ncbi:MAG TPA: hypothetical protein DEB24_00200 [Coriobacteriia bacterium]|nr:hypothetical protein [Coriobacteriia bacterium]
MNTVKDIRMGTRVSSTTMSSETLAANADISELFSAAFSFPSPELAEALYSGNFQADLMDCLGELGIVIDSELRSRITACRVEQDREGLHESMRREYTRLYLTPGKYAIIHPYEGAFEFVAGGGKGSPTLFINPTAIAVETLMKRADALPENSRTEPVDSIFTELDFLRILYTRALACRNSGVEKGDGVAESWLDFAERFRAEHIDNWLHGFMSATIEQTRLDVYRWLAEVGRVVFEVPINNRS